MKRAVPLLLPAILGLLLAAGCGGQGGGSSATRLTVISRGFLPPSGEPGIRPPRLLEDALALWAPVSAREEASALAAFSPPSISSSLASGTRNWVPRTEEGSTRAYLLRFTGERRPSALRALGRAEGYMDMLRATLRRHGLPPVLACLPLVESAFENGAVSSAGAAGLWQLMPHTARRFGLVVSDRLDERLDARKATEAAAAYLAFLYTRFGDWPLAVAAYNCGEGAMQRALRRTGARTLEELTAACRQAEGESILPDETLRFAPRFAAAALVMAESAALGLSVRPLLASAPLPARLNFPAESSRPALAEPAVQRRAGRPGGDAPPFGGASPSERLPKLSGRYDPEGETPPDLAVRVDTGAPPPRTKWLPKGH